MSDRKPVTRAGDVMTEEVVFIDGIATSSEAASSMRSRKSRALIVQKRHDDDAWGIVAVQDLITGVLLEDRSPDEVHVYEIMTKPVITVPADMDVRYAVRLLFRAGVRRAPVEKNGVLVGMISLTSLILDDKLFP